MKTTTITKAERDSMAASEKCAQQIIDFFPIGDRLSDLPRLSATVLRLLPGYDIAPVSLSLHANLHFGRETKNHSQVTPAAIRWLRRVAAHVMSIADMIEQHVNDEPGQWRLQGEVRPGEAG